MGGLVAAFSSVALIATLLSGQSTTDARDDGLLADPALEPPQGMAVGLGVQRLHDDFGLTLRVSTPRMLDDHLAIVLAGGLGWYPDLRALPEDVADQNFGAWSMYGHARLGVELSTRVSNSVSRLYATLGPSLLVLSDRLSTKKYAVGLFGALGGEIFAGDGFRTYPMALFFELGATAHDAAADIANRFGPVEKTDTTVDRSIATGLLIAGGLRVYLWR
ncbi:MAG: hypothetical protein IPK13_08405 [Deltaproteobacteria bacterium]|nr:hypothetical protein [Deltaproteobacteria bacterium]